MSLRIDQALTSRFIAGAYGIGIAHENLPYSPTIGTAYAELNVLPNDETAFSANDSDETDGIFRIILRYPENAGAIPAKTMADSIFDGFKVGDKFTYDGQMVEITGRQRAPGVRETGWYKLVLSIAYQAFTRRG